MRIGQIKSTIKLIYKLIIVSPKTWRTPSHKDILLYDATGWDVLSKYLQEYSVAVLATNGESLNVPCLIRASITTDFWKGGIFRAYVRQYIQAVSPRLILTFIDNSNAFYKISKLFPTCQTLFLQNGIRAKTAEIFSDPASIDRYHVDYMLVHNEDMGRYYCQYISGKSVVVGSLINNLVHQKVNSSPSDIVFISQWRPRSVNNDMMYTPTAGVYICWEQFYEAEVVALKFLAGWAKRNAKTIKICAVSESSNGLENEFYATHLAATDWQFIPRRSRSDSYHLVDSADIVVFIDSTLGYEAIARGKKVAGFSSRLSEIPSQHRKFGWPCDLPDTGPCWTNSRDEKEFERIMNYLNQVTDTAFQTDCAIFLKKLMIFDQDNTRFVSLLKRLMQAGTHTQDVN